ncbi:hypothetical protein ACWGIB_28315 [Streptomyces xiamenensis]
MWWHEPGGRCVETGYGALDDILVSELDCGTGCDGLGGCGYGRRPETSLLAYR